MKRHALIALLLLLLLGSAGLNGYLLFRDYDCYLQSPDEIYIMESGILKRYETFAEGETVQFTYDFDHASYDQLRTEYDLERLAGEGSELERALRLMNTFAPRLRHQSDYDNHVEMNALALLSYSLDNPAHGINCRSKAQILNEMCLALDIHARKVWIMPNSVYDQDCHVVNEIWDTALGKWVMLDITNNQYWVDERGTPLSILEIRDRGAAQAFCTPVAPGEALNDLTALQRSHIDTFLYIMKNLAYIQYLDTCTVGETGTRYRLLPAQLPMEGRPLISRSSCEAAPGH